MNISAAASPGANSLDDRLAGSRRALFWRELLGNAAHFPLANLFYEIVVEGWEMLTAPDAYVLIGAALTQAWVVSGWQRAGRSRPMLSNLLGPAVYVVLETLIEGSAFFAQPNHSIYVVFGVGVGLLRWALARSTNENVRLLLVLAEGLSRGLVLLFMYAALESRPGPDGLVKPFFADQSHQYITLALVALGLLIGLLAYFEQRTLGLLRSTAGRLRQFSEWSLGRDLTSQAVADADALSLRAVELAVLFVDLRGFTAWSENHPPREVVHMLNDFYAVVDHALAGTRGIVKIKFTADEAMVVLREPETALAFCRQLRDRLAPFLASHALAAGIGLHHGATVQGLLGSESVRLFDVIGDTVNVAKRLCDAAQGGEILVSESCYRSACATNPAPANMPYRDLALKGKAAPLRALIA